jgi:hypothetical protein
MDRDLLSGAFIALQTILEDADLRLADAAAGPADGGWDAAWQVSAPGQASRLLIDAFARFAPRDVSRVEPAPDGPSTVVVAPWLSPRSRELLAARGLNYLDLTGNVRLNVARPTIRVRLDGAQHDPSPPVKPPVRLRGASVNALVRVLVDVEPPYKMVDLARATGLSNAYVSRTLEALHEEGLIDRSRNRTVTDVDWAALLRTRAAHYDLLKTNRSQMYVARSGARDVYRRLSDTPDPACLITGSFAATEYVQIAAPSQLVGYVRDSRAFAARYGLVPAEQGADVVLLRANDDSQLWWPDARRAHVGVSQLALDCLAGNGRLPEEGEALLGWMAEHTSNWRTTNLPTADIVAA